MSAGAAARTDPQTDAFRLMLDIQAQMGAMMTKVETVAKDMAIVTMDMQQVKSAVVDVRKDLGSETTNEEGRKTGTGLLGRVGRIENQQIVYDRWANRATGLALGFSVAATAFGGFLWWLLESRLGELLQVAAK